MHKDKLVLKLEDQFHANINDYHEIGEAWNSGTITEEFTVSYLTSKVLSYN